MVSLSLFVWENYHTAPVIKTSGPLQRLLQPVLLIDQPAKQLVRRPELLLEIGDPHKQLVAPGLGLPEQLLVLGMQFVQVLEYVGPELVSYRLQITLAGHPFHDGILRVFDRPLHVLFCS
jgi:hypothetical protein